MGLPWHEASIPYMFPPYLIPRLAALVRFPRRRLMASLPNHSTLSKAPVSISYPSLLAAAAPSTLSHSIGVSILYCTPCQSSLFISHPPHTEQAFGSGPDCLGIIVVRDLPPKYPELRERLLKLAYAFAQLDGSARENYADAKSRYRFGLGLALITS